MQHIAEMQFAVGNLYRVIHRVGSYTRIRFRFQIDGEFTEDGLVFTRRRQIGDAVVEIDRIGAQRNGNATANTVFNRIYFDKQVVKKRTAKIKRGCGIVWFQSDVAVTVCIFNKQSQQ